MPPKAALKAGKKVTFST